jgi:hypothetical protein
MPECPIVISLLHPIFLPRTSRPMAQMSRICRTTASLLHRNAEVEPHLPHIQGSSLNGVSVINQSEYRYQLRRKASIYVAMVSKKRRRKSVSSDAESGKLSRNRKELSS